MKLLRLVLFVTLSMMALSAHTASTACDAACKEAQINAYFDRLSEVYREGSARADIDRFFELFAPNVRYAHMEYDANFERAEWKGAFIGNLERGAYKKDDNELIEVTEIIHGRSHSAVEYRYMRRTKDGEMEPADDQGGLLALFGFEGEQIVLIEEYW